MLCFIFYALFSKQICLESVKLVKCKNVIQFPEKLNAVASTKDSWYKVSRNLELIQKYRHLQFQPVLFTVSKTTPNFSPPAVFLGVAGWWH